jgi:hypothetical protein
VVVLKRTAPHSTLQYCARQIFWIGGVRSA